MKNKLLKTLTIIIIFLILWLFQGWIMTHIVPLDKLYPIP